MFFGCSNVKKEILQREIIDITITKINPPKHYRAYGIFIGQDTQILLFSQKHCNMKAKVGDIIQGEKVYYIDGTIRIKTNRELFCN